MFLLKGGYHKATLMRLILSCVKTIILLEHDIDLVVSCPLEPHKGQALTDLLLNAL